MGCGMDPSRKRAIRLTVALTVALLLASALVYTSFSAGRDELTASQLVKKARPGQTYILAGTVLNGSVQRDGGELLFRVRDPKLKISVPSATPARSPTRSPPAAASWSTSARAAAAAHFVGQPNSLTTKCPSKYQAASGSY